MAVSQIESNMGQRPTGLPQPIEILFATGLQRQNQKFRRVVKTFGEHQFFE